ncbi:MAG: hypothetical protein A2314_09045 [Elusimicrobia bacterium RIFOXYB2_FULL_50_12]|nr:MAG: hypothetical protein A2314_09045 [Elusimicrobia bacterium RIFOXYB2_FULL_50_12]
MQPQVDDIKYPVISIIVPVKNGERTIARCIESIRALSYPRFELIAINDGSTDGTAAILRSFSGDSRISAIETAGIGPSAARNKAIAHARGEYLAFTDGDCIVEPAWLDELLSGFNAVNFQRIGAVGGVQESPDDDTTFGKTTQQFMKAIGFITDYAKDGRNCDIIRATTHNASCNVMYRKEVFDKIGLFHEGMWPGEDVELDLRATMAGYTLLFNPKAVVRHYRPQNMAGFRRMMQRYGYAQAILVKEHGYFRPIQYVPVLTAAACVTSVIMAVNGYAVYLLAGCASILALIHGYFFAGTKRPLQHAMLFINTLIFWHCGFYSTLLNYNETTMRAFGGHQ